MQHYGYGAAILLNEKYRIVRSKNHYRSFFGVQAQVTKIMNWHHKGKRLINLKKRFCLGSKKNGEEFIFFNIA